MRCEKNSGGPRLRRYETFAASFLLVQAILVLKASELPVQGSNFWVRTRRFPLRHLDTLTWDESQEGYDLVASQRALAVQNIRVTEQGREAEVLRSRVCGVYEV